jgi:hypothetical protein
MFATLAATVLVELVRPRPLRIALMLALWMWAIAYIPSALRRVYGGGWAGVIVRAGGLVAAYVVLLVAAVAAIGVLLVLTY